MPKVPLSSSLRRLVASLESTERLDVLLHMHAWNGRPMSARAIAASCRISVPAAQQHLAKLCARGYVAVEIGQELEYVYRPVSPAVHRTILELERELPMRRDEIISVIGARQTALVAEDDADMREILRLFLDSRGFRTTAVPHGREARLVCEAENLTLAVVDVRSSLTQGLGLVRTLRERTRAVPTIVTTSFGDARIRASIASLGVTHVLEKPFDLDELGHMVEQCCPRSLSTSATVEATCGDQQQVGLTDPPSASSRC